MCKLKNIGVVDQLVNIIADGVAIGKKVIEEAYETAVCIAEIKTCGEEHGQPCVCGALVQCTSAIDKSEAVHMIKYIKGNAVKVAEIEQLDECDIYLEKPFSGCMLSNKNKCILSYEDNMIEGDVWQDIDTGVKQGPTGRTLNANWSYMICNHGPGVIYFKDSGQKLKIYVNKAYENMCGDIQVQYVTAQQLEAINWHNVTPELVDDLNRVLEKYEITTIERIRHFLAQCMKESERGKGLREGDYKAWANQDEYEAAYNKKAYGYKYRGAGYLQLTWDYSYLAFATYMIKQECTDLDIEWFSYSDHNTGFQEMYNEAVKKAEDAGYDVERYKKIVTEGADYVGIEFPWESAGFDWYAKGCNTVVDQLQPNNTDEVDEISEIINPGASDESLEERRNNYNELTSIIQ